MPGVRCRSAKQLKAAHHKTLLAQTSIQGHLHRPSSGLAKVVLSTKLHEPLRAVMHRCLCMTNMQHCSESIHLQLVIGAHTAQPQRNVFVFCRGTHLSSIARQGHWQGRCGTQRKSKTSPHPAQQGMSQRIVCRKQHIPAHSSATRVLAVHSAHNDAIDDLLTMDGAAMPPTAPMQTELASRPCLLGALAWP